MYILRQKNFEKLFINNKEIENFQYKMFILDERHEKSSLPDVRKLLKLKIHPIKQNKLKCILIINLC